MKNVDILNNINDITRKHKSGKTLTEESFNRYMEVAQNELMEIKEDQYERDAESTTSLSRFKVPEQVSIDGSGQVAYSSLGQTYWRFSSGRYTGAIGDIEWLTDKEYAQRLSSGLLAPSDEFPVVTEQSTFLQFDPLVSVNADIVYLRVPTTPHLDWYIDGNTNIVYLDEGEVHTWTTGEIDSSGTTHTTGDADYSSLTAELEWNERDKVTIMYAILQKIGVSLQKMDVTQYGIAKEQLEQQ